MVLEKENFTIQIVSERSLSKEQKLVLQLTVDGYTVQEICSFLNLNKLKVELHLHSLIKKFNADTKERLIRLVAENGVIR